MKKVSTLLVFCIFSHLLFAQKEGRMVILNRYHNT